MYILMEEFCFYFNYYVFLGLLRFDKTTPLIFLVKYAIQINLN